MMVASYFLIFPHLLECFHFWKSVFLLWKKPLLPSLILLSGRNQVHGQHCPSMWGPEQLWVRWLSILLQFMPILKQLLIMSPFTLKRVLIWSRNYIIILDINSLVSFYLFRFLHVSASSKTRGAIEEQTSSCPPRCPLSPQSRGYN